MARRYGSGGSLVFDTSAWVRQAAGPVAPRWRTTFEAGLVRSCPVVTLELLATARDEDAAVALEAALASLIDAPVTRAACNAALAASRQLRGERRIPAADYLVAAAAAERGSGVLHYDGHFDLLADALGIESVWIAPPGSLD